MSKNILNKQNFSKLNEKLKKYENILLFLDYDGTLSHFKKDPQSANPVKGIEKIIKNITKYNFIKVTIISGRSLKDLKNMIKLKKVYYAGLHGLEMKNYNPQNLNREKIKFYKNKIKKNYKTEINNNNLYLEDKKFVLSIHYREEFQDIDNLEKTINNLTDKNIFEVMSGRKIIEIKPKSWNKGKAVKMIRKNSWKNKKTLEIYIGDDTTDEDAFSVINDFSIYVKNENNMSEKADFFLKDPDEVYKFLKKFNHSLENIT